MTIYKKYSKNNEIWFKNIEIKFYKDFWFSFWKKWNVSKDILLWELVLEEGIPSFIFKNIIFELNKWIRYYEKNKLFKNNWTFILKDNILILWCACLWWIMEHHIIVEKYIIEWIKIIEFKFIFSSNKNDNILLSYNQIKVLKKFLKK